MMFDLFSRLRGKGEQQDDDSTVVTPGQVREQELHSSHDMETNLPLPP